MRIGASARRLAILFVCAFALSNCAVYMAANQPDKKDTGVLAKGNARSTVIAELGTPVTTTKKDGLIVDLYSFTQGYSGAEKGGRALVHGAADFFTLGLWEIVGTPIEGYATGTKIVVEVTYDRDERVQNVVAVRGQEKLAQETKNWCD